jgi:hypothetical protein
LVAALAAGTDVSVSGNRVRTVINPRLYSLTTEVSPPGAGTITPLTAMPFAENTVMQLTATPGACYGAATWSANAPGGTVVMTSNQVVTATFPPAGMAQTAPSVTATPQGVVRLNIATGRYVQEIVLSNSGPALTDLSLIFDNLTAGATVYGASGTTICAPAGSPYLNLANLNPGSSSAIVEFVLSDPTIEIRYTPRVVAGAGQR